MSRPFAETALVRQGVSTWRARARRARCSPHAVRRRRRRRRSTSRPSWRRAKKQQSRPRLRPRPEARQAANAKVESAGSGRRGRRGEPPPAADPASAPIPASAQSAYDRALTAMRTQDWLRAESELGQLTTRISGLPGTAGESRDRLPEREAADRRTRCARSCARDRSQARRREQRARDPVTRDGEVRRGRARVSASARDRSEYALAHYNLGVLLDVYLRRGRRGDRAIRGCIRARSRRPTRRSPVGSSICVAAGSATARRKSRRRMGNEVADDGCARRTR